MCVLKLLLTLFKLFIPNRCKASLRRKTFYYKLDKIKDGYTLIWITFTIKPMLVEFNWIIETCRLFIFTEDSYLFYDTDCLLLAWRD